MRVQGAVAVVTGGASGIGAAVAGALEEAGARVVVWDVAAGSPVTCDVADEVSVAAAIGETLALAGPPSILVTAAGVGSFGSLADLGRAEWERVLAVNLTGTWLCLKAVVPHMRRFGGGAAVCISSVSGQIADRGMGAYCCSKAGVDMLVKVAAAEWGPEGVRVNAVAPGVTDTPMAAGALSAPAFARRVVANTALGRVGGAGEVAAAVVALIGADWVTGQVLAADGGLLLHSPMDPQSLDRP